MNKKRIWNWQNIMWLTLIVACGDSAPTVPSAEEQKQSLLAAAAEQAAAERAAEEAEEAAQEEQERLAREATPRGQARLAYLRGDYTPDSEICAYLIAEAFDSDICTFLMHRAADERASLSARHFERFLRAQHVRQRRGRIVGWYDESAGEYEARIGGHTAILSTVDTTFQTTGGFRLWAQRIGESEEELWSGRVLNVPIYREWILYKAIRDLARQRGEGSRNAEILVGLLIGTWEELCLRDLEDPDSRCVHPSD